MKLHASVVKKLLRVFDLHGGRRDDKQLTREIENLDLDVYQQTQNPKQEKFIVLTEDLKPKPK